MNAQDLVTHVKLRLDDEVAPRVFRDADILKALNDAQNEFALRTLCIFDGEDTVSVRAQSPWVTLPAGTLWVTAAWLDATSPLRLVTQHELEFGYFELNGAETTSRYSAWRNAEGEPSFLITDLGPTQARLVPRPVTGTELFLERYRLPDADIAIAPEVNPEIPVQHHSDLVIGALAFLFDIPDEEVYDRAMASAKRAAWETRLQIAENLLQTALRIQLRVVPPPPGTSFVQVGANTIGANQNANT